MNGYFSTLSLYDLLGNFAPGAALLLFFLAVPAGAWFPTSTGAYAIFFASSLLIGHFIQYHASFSVDDWQLFNKVMKFSRNTFLSDSSGSETKNRSDPCVWLFYVLKPFYLPISCWFSRFRNDAGNNRAVAAERLQLENVANEAWWQLYFNKFDDTLERDDQRFDQMLYLMSSKLESASHKPRSIRFQAIRNLQRGMWITSWYSTLFLLAILLINKVAVQGESLPVLGIMYTEPYLFQLPGPNYALLFLSVPGIFGFWHLFNTYDRLFTRYLFIDYLVEVEQEDQPSGDTNLTNDGDESLQVGS